MENIAALMMLYGGAESHRHPDIFVETDISTEAPAPKKILSFGDSISILSYPQVQSQLGSAAVVTHIPDNGMYTQYSIDHFREWIADTDHYDLIWCNWGLHDIAHSLPGPAVRTTPDDYRANIHLLLSMLETHTKCLVVALTTTSPPDYPQDFRSNDDVIAYNVILADEANRVGATIVDLYTPTYEHSLWNPDNVNWYAPGEIHPYDYAADLAEPITTAIDNQYCMDAELPLDWRLLLILIAIVGFLTARRARRLECNG